jgi:hypothetical protein
LKNNIAGLRLGELYRESSLSYKWLRNERSVQTIEFEGVEMKTYRTNALMAGVLYIVGTAAGILSVYVVGGFPDEDFLARMAADPSRITLGAFLILIMGFSLAAMTLFLYPVFRKDSEPLAMGMVLFRGAFEGTWYILAALIWVILGALVKEIASAGADSATLQAVGQVVLQADGKLGDIGTFAFIIGAACLYTSFYRTRLIPRWLSGWGLVAALPYLVYYLLHFFDIDPGLMFLVLPLAVQEMVMGLWLIIKGFNPDAVKELDRANPPATQAAD